MVNLNKTNSILQTSNPQSNEVQLKKRLSKEEKKTYSVGLKPIKILSKYELIPTNQTALVNAVVSLGKRAMEYTENALNAINR